VRTGGQFGTFLHASDAPGLSPVCRFYGTAGTGPTSHFYTPDAAECELVKKAPGWTYEGTAFYIQEAKGGLCPAGTTPVMRSYNDGFARNDSNHRYHRGRHGIREIRFVRLPAGRRGDVRAALERRRGGRRRAAAAPGHVRRDGGRGPARRPDGRRRMDRRAARHACLQISRLPVGAGQPAGYVRRLAHPADHAESFCARDNYTLFQLQLQFFRDALAQPDQLRQRVAFALSQIMVVSGLDNARNYAMREYQQMLRDRAFGNFHDLLLAVTLSPVMGDYLDMANNNKRAPPRGPIPTRTTRARSCSSSPSALRSSIPTALRSSMPRASPRDLRAGRDQGLLARLHGLDVSRRRRRRAAPQRQQPRNYLGDMLAVDANHDFGSKPLLRGIASPTGLAMRRTSSTPTRTSSRTPTWVPSSASS
jgi:hypothetical protein